jgi:hypothetical protein
MVLKELDPFSGQDKFQIAGRKAEEQMAHYLRRFFGSSIDVDVLNYLRIDLGGEVAQMDHLVLHPFGLLIVESKSVAGSVQIKEDGQWIRWFNKRPHGMRSPVTQAKMQVMLLNELLAKTVKQKGFFEQVQMDVLVAISDSGTIQWATTGALPEVCKADQVPERVNHRVDEFRRVRQDADVLTAEHRRVIAEFLCKVHRPIAREISAQQNAEEPSRAYEEPAVSTTAPTQQPGKVRQTSGLPHKACKHCGEIHLEARHGQYGYYFYCEKCAKNTGIKFACPTCGGEGRIRKQGRDFFAECKACDASFLYHSN